jgi:hypothetical protein
VSSALEVRYLAESDHDRWSTFVRSTPGGTIYSSPEYLDALCSATGGRFRVLVALRGTEIGGGIALYEERQPYGAAVADRLLLYYHPIVLREYPTRYPSERTSRQLETLQALAAHLDALPCARLVVHTPGLLDARPFLRRDWTVRPGYTYVVPIADLGAAWARVEQNQRRLVGRCEREGARFCADDDFADFYRLHEAVHRRKEAPLYLPEPAFRAFFERLSAQGLATIYHVRLADGRSVAAQAQLLGPYPVAHTVCAGADESALKLGTTPFLRWKAFEALAGRGYAANDLTDATLNPVTRFKSQLGGDLVTNTVLVRPDRAAYRLHGWRQDAGRVARRLASGVGRRLGVRQRRDP